MTQEEAMSLCELIPDSAYTRNGEISNNGFIEDLRKRFPGFNWRIILDRSGYRTEWCITVDDNDPREHYVPKSKYKDLPNKCIHCGKTAEELGVAEREREDDD